MRIPRGAPKAHSVIEVHSRYYDVGLIGLRNDEVAEASAQVCGRLREPLRPLRISAGDLMPYSQSRDT